ncbi:MAG: fructose 1,6-bisphosphatase [Myxococcales bacterium SG8_38_1]|nr:MAG: fructose 1,6-bisphosphatase [Myxococcales bacterium SG8_38_1]
MTRSASIGPIQDSPIGTTLERHLLDRQRRMPGLFQQISLAAKIIGSRVSKAGLLGILGRTGVTNVQGEQVQKLDEFANTVIVQTVEAGGHVCVMGSEEVEDPITIPKEYPQGKYVLQFDPLDGSGNIDINASIGTIFSIHRRVTPPGQGSMKDLLQKGSEIVAAGYVIYGSSNMLVYSTGEQVDGFTYDPGVGEFFLSHPRIRIPQRGGIYSINEGNYHNWSEGTKRWVDWIKTPTEDKKAYRLRYIGAMVADIHRTLLRGGIFVYPHDVKNEKGKLRLLYEASPMAFIVEAAGGAASDGKSRILDIQPTSLHQRTPVFIGSPDDVADALRFANA